MSVAITKKEGLGLLEKCGLGIGMLTGSLAFDSSYPTGGESVDLSNIFSDIHLVLIEPKAGYVFEYDYTNKKVKAYWADYDGAADAVLIEVTDTTDLSALTDVRFMAIGK